MTPQPPTKIWNSYQNCHSLRSGAQQGGNVHEAFQNLRNLQTTTIKRFDSPDKYCYTLPSTSQFHGMKENS